MEPPLRLFALRPAARFSLASGWGAISPEALLRSAFPVSGSQHDLKFNDLIPLSLGPLPFRDRQELLQATTRGNWLWVIHGGIISSFGKAGPAISILPSRDAENRHVHRNSIGLR